MTSKCAVKQENWQQLMKIGNSYWKMATIAEYWQQLIQIFSIKSVSQELSLKIGNSCWKLATTESEHCCQVFLTRKCAAIFEFVAENFLKLSIPERSYCCHVTQGLACPSDYHLHLQGITKCAIKLNQSRISWKLLKTQHRLESYTRWEQIFAHFCLHCHQFLSFI